MSKTIRKIVIVLLIMGAAIYGLQLLIFHDPNTTAFYIFQDFAFLPISIAVATIVVGELLDMKEKRERQEKTQMLASAFFTELGAALMFQLIELVDVRDEIKEVFQSANVVDKKSLEQLQTKIKEVEMQVKLDEESYNALRTMIDSRRQSLLVISSNPLLLDHENFTNLLWSIFHIMDEFRLRGEYSNLKKPDIIHLEVDFTEILELLLINWSNNVLYMRNNYPNFFNAAVGKLQERK